METRTIEINGEKIEVTTREDKNEGILFNIILVNQCFSLLRLSRAQQLLSYYLYSTQIGWVPLIIDLGANVGFSSLYFSATWPLSQVCAVEPEDNNYQLLKKHTASKRNINPFCNAISNEQERVSIANPETNSPVSFIVKPDMNGEISTITVQNLLDQYPKSKKFLPFIIKIDIEGYENKLFSSNTEWIDQFPVIIIEPHDWMLPSSANFSTFIKAIADKDRDFVIIGENIFSIQNNLSIPIT